MLNGCGIILKPPVYSQSLNEVLITIPPYLPLLDTHLIHVTRPPIHTSYARTSLLDTPLTRMTRPPIHTSNAQTSLLDTPITRMTRPSHIKHPPHTYLLCANITARHAPHT